MQNSQQADRLLPAEDEQSSSHSELKQALEFALMLADNSGQRLVAAKLSQIIELIEEPDA